MNPSEYFRDAYGGSDVRRRAIYVRISNALRRRMDIADMSQLCLLCETNKREVRRMRDIGKISLSVIYEETEKYKKHAMSFK